ncbi:MAG TPA: Gfo/Idh/MocA family oxidoreductase [Vicinamibacterales bacterium]|nr:Gfo/Idh/MocA family oxidoreductase [Vicinamibacterales bacterium]
MSRLRWGLLGTARINRLIIPAIRASARSEVTAVASRTLDRAQAYAAEWKIPRAIAAYQTLVDDPEVDVIYIGLPNSLHVEWTVRALEGGKHVLCEKPLGLSVEDVDRIAATAARTSHVAAEAFMYRHHPLTHAVEATVRSGTLGAIRGYKGAFTFPLTREGDVRFDRALGGGSLWDVGCYPVSYVCLLAAQAPVEVFAWQQSSASGVDLALAGMMRFADGAIAQFDCGFLGPFRAAMEVIGADASLQIERPFKTDELSRVVLTRGDTTRTLPFTSEAPFAGEIADMEAAALDGRPPRIALTESRRTVATICALYESARTRRPAEM